MHSAGLTRAISLDTAGVTAGGHSDLERALGNFQTLVADINRVRT